MKLALQFSVVVVFVLGCSTKPPSIKFRLASDRPEYELSYIPIVDDGGEIRIATAFHKTADAPGYHKADIDLHFPENLATPWRTGALKDYDRVGIVVLERDGRDDPIIESAKVFWFGNEALTNSASQKTLIVPSPKQLPEFDIGLIRN